MVKIKKNLSDDEMLRGCKERESFENTPGADKPAPPSDPWSAFFTSQLQHDVGKALLALKVDLYKQGVVDFKLKVSREANRIILSAVPVKGKPGQQMR